MLTKKSTNQKGNSGGELVRSRRAKSKAKLITVLAIVVLVVAGALAYTFIIDPNSTALTVGNKKYTKQELQKIVDEAKKAGVARDDAIKKLTDYEKRKQAAKKLGVEPTKEQLDQASKSALTGSKEKIDTKSTWHKITIYPKALEAALQQAEAGYYTGTVFIFYFSRFIESLSSSQAMTPEIQASFRNPAAVASDREYAQERANHYHAELKAGRVDDSQVVSAIKADSRLSPNGALNQSGSFTTSPEGMSYLGSGASARIGGGWADSLPLISSPGLSDIKVGKVTQSDLPNTPEVDGNFYFIKVDSVKAPAAGIRQRFEQEINSW